MHAIVSSTPNRTARPPSGAGTVAPRGTDASISFSRTFSRTFSRAFSRTISIIRIIRGR